jgi:hypothetical protein
MCTFSINFSGDATIFVTKAETAIDDAGGSFTGNASAGNFSVSSPLGKIKGTYVISSPSTADITISQKPFLVSCNAIQSQLQEYVNS